MVLAFRLYGNFHWPPHPKIDALPARTRDGVVEIHYLEKGAAGTFRPALRWTPREQFSQSGSPPEITENLFDLTVKDAVDRFKDDQDYAIWIDAGKQTTDTDWLAFRGAFLIEQYRASNALAEATLDLRWPLVRSCAYAPGHTVFSGLDVGRRGGPRYCLNLHLPLPARRTTLLSGSQADPSAFPFCVVYEPGKKSSFERILNFTTLVGGWIEGDSVDTSAAPVSGTSFVFSDGKYPADASLGSFGFSARGQPGQGEFAVYDGKQKSATIDAAKFWPENSRPFTQDILARFGFSIDPASTKWPRLKAGGTTADLSLRFGKNKSDARKPVFTYRIAVSASDGDPTSADDITRSGDALSLRLSKETGGWVKTASALYADCRLSWDIGDGDIWSKEARRWSPKVDLSFHWKNNIPAGENFGGSPAAEADLDFGLLRHAAHTFRQTREALAPVEAAQPRSVLPDLQADGKQTVCFSLYGPSLEARFITNGTETEPDTGLLAWGRALRTGAPETPFIRPRLRLSLAQMADLIPGSDDTAGLVDNTLRLIASNLTFFNEQKPAAKINLTLSGDGGWAAAGSDEIANEPFFASYVVETLPAGTAWSGRLSSLAFDLSPVKGPLPAKPDDLTLTYLRAGGSGTRQGNSDGAPPLDLKSGRIAASIHLVLPVTNVKPVSIDVSRLDRSGRTAPLLITQKAAPGTQGGPSGYRYWLSVRETVAPTLDRRIEADIYESAPDAGEQSYVVLSQEPFSLFRYSHRPLSDRGDAGSASVAYYSVDDRIWQYRKVADYYHYILPAQAVAESADKPRRLEIHDLKDTDATDPSDAWRPYAVGADTGEDKTGMKRRAVEFRLTPSTEFWISPSDVERGYFMPKSSSHDIFRQRGEHGLGAALTFLRGEFLYGLSVGIDVSRGDAMSRQARVAEIEALTGKMTGPTRNADAANDLEARWNALCRAIDRRPERLEIWARDPDSTIDFTPARFASGVTYALRGTALHRPPLAKLEKPEDHALWPKAGPSRPLNGYLDETSRQDLSKPRSHPQGLSGGALWPVESVNLFNHLLERPESSGGTIEAIALSPTGGDAAQTAAFLGGIVTIISETRNGHVERQKVEVLGRIGAFWHRAKHVVVYERSVNASAQFAPKFVEDQQRTRSRRPILRKVAEYIELLEPERSYPDFAEAAPRCAGFLERLRFNSKIINVDSAWSSEVGDFGWKIPLWNMLSARERPQVYPMPDIAFVSTAEGDGDNPVVSQECLDTDNLYFFSDFKQDTSNTNGWRPYLDIDYANMPIAKEIAACADPKPDGASNAGHRRRAVSRVLPGVRRFTWRLAPAAQKTTINAGRAGKPVYVGLDSISFMRAVHTAKEQQTLRPELIAVMGNAGILRNPEDVEKLKKIESLAYWQADGTGALLPAAAEYSGAIGNLLDRIRAKDRTGVEAALKDFQEKWTSGGLIEQLRQAIPQAAGDGASVLVKLKLLDKTIDDGQTHCARLKSEAAGMIRRKEMLLATAMSDWAADIEHRLPALVIDGKPITTKTLLIEALTGLITEHLRPIFAEASQDVGNAGQSVEKAKSILAGVDMEIEAIHARARQRLEQFSAGYDREKPWSAERRRAFSSGLQATVSNVAGDITAAVDEARQRFAAELSGTGQAIGGHLAKSLTQLAHLADTKIAGAGIVRDSISRLLAPLTLAIDALSPAAGSGQLDTTIAAITTISDQIKAETGIDKKLRDDAVQALDALLEAADQAKSIIPETRVLLANANTLTDETLAEFAAIIANLTAQASSLVKTLSDKTDGIAALATAFLENGFEAIAAALSKLWSDIAATAKLLSGWLDGKLLKIAMPVDFLVAATVEHLDTTIEALAGHLQKTIAGTASVIVNIENGFKAAQQALAPERLLETVVGDKAIRPALQLLLAPIDENLTAPDILPAIHDRLTELSPAAVTVIRTINADTLGALDAVTAACNAVFEGVDDSRDYLSHIANGFNPYVDGKLEAVRAQYTPLVEHITQSLDELETAAQPLIDAVNAFDCSLRSLHNNLSRSVETARMYGDRVFDAASRLTSGGAMALPSNLLKLYSAVGSAPEIAALKADIDRIRSGFDDISDIIDTTEASALFNRLGDELKALGFDMAFDKIADRIQPKGLTLANFAGLNLDHLFKGQPLGTSLQEGVRASHDFDKAQGRAWVQIDIDARIRGRRTLFSLGVFQVDFIDMHLTGRVKLEASKDEDRVTQTGFSRIETTIDLIAGGQSMVKFEQFGLNFTREKGLNVEFDPKNIRLNPAFKFIQDFLSTLFPDEAGGLKIIKQDNIPVGVEHDFVIPPMTLNFGTSGVSNICIENHFKLLAFPDFLLANRFNLSSIERPFIFSIFVIGGTGYIQIDAEYRPFDGRLMVCVEAGPGGSAALAFAAGPFVGQVFITLSGVMTYRKMIGQSGGGLALSVVVVIAGHVEVCGMVSVGITLMLRLSYRENGEVNGQGSLAVSIRISRFFTISAHANVNYTLRGGKSETSVSTGVSGEVNDTKLQDKIDKAKQAVEQLQKASN